MSDTLTERIASKIDKTATGSLAIAKGGNLDFVNLNEIMEVAKVVAISQVAIPKHLRDNVGACLAICIQASEWRLSPFAVANKSYVVNDRLAFEAQLIASVILKRAPIIGRISYTYTGEGGTRRCKTTATLNDGTGTVEYESPEFDKITTKNSPLWKADPDQQLGYFAVRAMCRRHFPDVLLGIYTPEEMGEAIDVTATVREVPAARPQLFGSSVASDTNSPPALRPADEPTPGSEDARPPEGAAETTPATTRRRGPGRPPKAAQDSPAGGVSSAEASSEKEPAPQATTSAENPSDPQPFGLYAPPETKNEELKRRLNAAQLDGFLCDEWFRINDFEGTLTEAGAAQVLELWDDLVKFAKVVVEVQS